MTLLPWLLLLSTLTVRLLLARKLRAGFYLDLGTIPAWVAYYAHHGDYQLIAIPFVFGGLDLLALRRWWA